MSVLKEAWSSTQFVDRFAVLEAKINAEKRLTRFDLDDFCKKTQELDKQFEAGKFKKKNK